MNALSGDVAEYLQSRLHFEIAATQRLAGGDVSGATLITTTTGERLVVKQNSDARAGMFAAEADGLHRLGAKRAIRVPEVLAVNDTLDTPPFERFIAMEYLPSDEQDTRMNRSTTLGQAFGAALATLHRDNPSRAGEYGLEVTSFLGRRPLNNTWNASWPEFYKSQRIEPILHECREALGEQLQARVTRLCGAIPELLAGIPNTPCLIHGDLWSGNYLISGGAPVLIDPAAYYGHPEHEWAYMELFGGFPPGMRTGYDSVAPLSAGYEERRPLLQLFHLLVHVARFGQPYVPAVRQVCAAYGI